MRQRKPIAKSEEWQRRIISISRYTWNLFIKTLLLPFPRIASIIDQSTLFAFFYHFFPYLVSFGRAQWKQYYPYWMTLESTVEDIFNAMFRRQCAVFTCICGLSNSLQYKIRCNVATTVDRNNATFFKKKRESARGGDWTHDGRVAFKGLFERSLAQKLRKPNVAISTKL